ncbi:hypothetical protein AAHE18_03G120500 [Arachis hypogaea]
MLLVADDLFHKNPYIHAAWHLAATISVSTCNKLLDLLEFEFEGGGFEEMKGK